MASLKTDTHAGLPAACCCIAGGMLSSSCCVIQLLFNYLSIGCAGFSVLTPYRHYFRLITGGFLSYMLATQGVNRRTLSTALISCLLMASQDLLGAQNRGDLQRIPQFLSSYKLLSSLQEQYSQQPAAQKVVLHVQGMKCEACAARLRRNVAGLDSVDSCTVDFQKGQVEVWSNSSEAVQPQVLMEAVRATDDSYKVDVIARKCYNAADQRRPCPEGVGALGQQ